MNFASDFFPAFTLTGRSARPAPVSFPELILWSEYPVEERLLIVFEQDVTSVNRLATTNSTLVLWRIRFFRAVKKLLEVWMVRNLMENLLFDIDWRLGPNRDRNCIARTRIDRKLGRFRQQMK